MTVMPYGKKQDSNLEKNNTMTNLTKHLLFFSLLLMASIACEQKSTSTSPSSSTSSSSEAGYDPEAKLEELGITLPSPPQPVANYVNGVQAGNLIFLAGKGPRYPDGVEITGKVGTDVTIEKAYEGARLTAINQLAVLKHMLGNLNRVKRIVKVLGMVNCDPTFVDQPKVINGFSDLMVEVFGEKGKHARAAVGMASLPRGQSVEIELVVEIYD